MARVKRKKMNRLTSSVECQSVWETCVFSCHYQVNTGKCSVLGETLHLVLRLQKKQLGSLSGLANCTIYSKDHNYCLKSTGCRYLSTAFKKASISSSFPHHPASNDKGGSNSRGLVGVCSFSLPSLSQENRGGKLLSTTPVWNSSGYQIRRRHCLLATRKSIKVTLCPLCSFLFGVCRFNSSWILQLLSTWDIKLSESDILSKIWVFFCSYLTLTPLWLLKPQSSDLGVGCLSCS